MLMYDKSMQIFTAILYAVVLTITLVVAYFLRDKNDIKKRIPLYIISGLIILIEIHKQFRNFLGYDYTKMFGFVRGCKGEFTSYAFPFHFCSFFVFWLIFQFVFWKNKRIKKFFENMSFLWASMIAVLMFFYPDMIYGGAVSDLMAGGEPQHTIFFHSLVLLYFAIACSLRTYSFEKNKFYQAPICMLLYGAIAIPAAHIFKENYCSLYKPEGWGFLEPVFNKGYFAYDSTIVLIGLVVSLIVYFAIFGVEKLRDMLGKNHYWFFFGYVVMIPMLFIVLVISKATGYDAMKPFYSLILFAVALLCLAPAIVKSILTLKNEKTKQA